MVIHDNLVTYLFCFFNFSIFYQMFKFLFFFCLRQSDQVQKGLPYLHTLRETQVEIWHPFYSIWVNLLLWMKEEALCPWGNLLECLWQLEGVRGQCERQTFLQTLFLLFSPLGSSFLLCTRLWFELVVTSSKLIQFQEVFASNRALCGCLCWRRWHSTVHDHVTKLEHRS